MNTDVSIGNGIYFLVLSIVILASTIFVVHMLGESGENIDQTPQTNLAEQYVTGNDSQVMGTYTSPFEVDLDLLAEHIIPRMNPKERIEDYAGRILRNVSKHFEIVQGIFFLKNQITKQFESISTFAYTSDKRPSSFQVGEGINGQVAKDKRLMHLTSIPEGYLKIESGLGKSSPTNLLIIPLLLHKETIGIIELASFQVFDEETVWTFKNLAKMIGNAMVTKMKAVEKK